MISVCVARGQIFEVFLLTKDLVQIKVGGNSADSVWHTMVEPRSPVIGEMNSEYLRETLHRFKLLLSQNQEQTV